MSCLVLLNARAGTLLSGGLERPREVVAEAFETAGRPAEVHLVDPEEMGPRLEAASRSDHEVVVVGGGDGTFSHALAKLAGSGKVLGLLPLGTVNLLGRDLMFPAGGLPEMARALAGGEVRHIDLATVNGRPFHSLCGLGYFSRVAREREQTRFNIPLGRLFSVTMSVWRSVTKTGRVRFSIDVGDRRFNTDAYAILVTNNRIGDDWRRAQLDEGVLELHLMRHSHLAGRARAGFELIAGRWREGDAIESFAAQTFTISSARSRVWMALDGELVREPTPLRFHIQPGGLRMLVPSPSLTEVER
ncbi:diacylglycerol/lipid kinase family protein [Terrihabitans rhizophilus]|jgi:diacylglycerol kinase family enzyme|uniref:Diacylglycerol kinase family protein n=1 Tax=Terrihabitans rhizophilus TaxID=3092662 RepID=A0ABU4RRU1_9HYPH|nr:diacylglycerol kinase family protein [Terrihabitans sp. PJ23]MDX6807569.1 diacylglycerol kinase family protein [Terrihabitans sp. PJ23]